MGFRKLSKIEAQMGDKVCFFLMIRRYSAMIDYLNVKLDFFGPSHVFSDLYKNKKEN